MSWKNILSSVAPALGTAIGGPFGGIAARAISNKLLGRENASEEEIEAAIASATPEDLLKLKEVENQFVKDMKALEVDVLNIDKEDRKSARDMAAAKGMLPQILLSIAYSVAYGVVLYAFMSGQINVPEGQQVLFGSLIGILTGAQVQILNFWFGSSAGSKEKTMKMNQ